MNFYFDAAKILDKIDAKQGSIKGVLSTVSLENRKRMSAAVIRTLECECFLRLRRHGLNVLLHIDKAALSDIITASELLKQEKKIIPTPNLALVLVHDLLFSKGIEAGDGPIKRAVLRHKTRLHSELVKLKMKRNVRDNKGLARSEQPYVGTFLEIRCPETAC